MTTTTHPDDITPPDFFINTLDAYAAGRIGWHLAYLVVDRLSYELAEDGHRDDALTTWASFAEAHEARLDLEREGATRGVAFLDPRIRPWRTRAATNAIWIGRRPEDVEADERCVSFPVDTSRDSR